MIPIISFVLFLFGGIKFYLIDPWIGLILGLLLIGGGTLLVTKIVDWFAKSNSQE